MIILSDTQNKALNQVKKWYRETQYKKQYQNIFVLSGTAGSGKSTIIEHFMNDENLNEENCMFMAPTGKACMALRSKGVPAVTIHKSIYTFTFDERTKKFHKNIKGADEFIKIKLIVIDEISMVSKDILNDVLQYQIPVLVVGDHNQLPFFVKNQNNGLLDNPDVRLEEIHRQAKDNPIIRISSEIIQGKILKPGKYDSSVVISDKMNFELMARSSQVICGTNRVRNSLNSAFRKSIFKDSFKELPLKDDKMICRRNNWFNIVGSSVGELPLMNGLIGYALEDYQQGGRFKFMPDMPSHTHYESIFDEMYILEGEPMPPIKVNGKTVFFDLFEYAYAVTCHLSQGSEFENVYLIHEPIGSSYFDRRRWTYTAITRASEKIYIQI